MLVSPVRDSRCSSTQGGARRTPASPSRHLATRRGAPYCRPSSDGISVFHVKHMLPLHCRARGLRRLETTRRQGRLLMDRSYASRATAWSTLWLYRQWSSRIAGVGPAARSGPLSRSGPGDNGPPQVAAGRAPESGFPLALCTLELAPVIDPGIDHEMVPRRDATTPHLPAVHNNAHAHGGDRPFSAHRRAGGRRPRHVGRWGRHLPRTPISVPSHERWIELGNHCVCAPACVLFTARVGSHSAAWADCGASRNTAQRGTGPRLRAAHSARGEPRDACLRRAPRRWSVPRRYTRCVPWGHGAVPALHLGTCTNHPGYLWAPPHCFT